MRAFCVCTEQHKFSRKFADECIASAKSVGLTVERFPSVHWDNIDVFAEALGVRLRLQPHKKSTTTDTHCPAFRIANGLTHYRLYTECASGVESFCILEHDAMFKSPLPATHPVGVTQISSHRRHRQFDSEWYQSGCNSKRHVAHGPEPDFSVAGIIPHPYKKAVGTSGYIITPDAAGKMVDHIRANGVAYADCLSRDVVGTLWFAIPQPVELVHRTLNYYK